MRCITAIWPAGPPKLWAATRAHTLAASPKVGGAGVGGVPAVTGGFYGRPLFAAATSTFLAESRSFLPLRTVADEIWKNRDDFISY
jgi:hypothetical protein